MRYGARNAVPATVRSVERGDLMALAKFDIATPAVMASVLTNESVDDLQLSPGDEVLLVVKAVNVMPVKE
jgi:molybdopterin-binding protein